MKHHHNLQIKKEGGTLYSIRDLSGKQRVYVKDLEKYVPNSSDGIRWNDPKLKIDWPMKPTVISEKDKSWGFL